MRLLLVSILFFSICVAAQNQAILFDQSYLMLHNMLDNKEPYSFKKAVLSTENAYLDGGLDTIEVNKKLKLLHSVSLILLEYRDIQYAEKDKETIHKFASVFQVMHDSINIKINGTLYRHLPYQYDFSDVFGHDNPENLFVSKLLATRKGNCHSLPYLYKIIAEDLGVEANLALAPNHIYIKHKSLLDGWYNTELTSGIFPVDAWLMASGYMHIDAVTNGVYMKALDKKESIALLMIDLAEYYNHRLPDNDGKFVLQCCDAALSAYPHFAKALILKAETHKKQVDKSEDTAQRDAAYKDLAKEYSLIHALGYRNMPESMYLNWLLSLKEQRTKYENKKL